MGTQQLPPIVSHPLSDGETSSTSSTPTWQHSTHRRCSFSAARPGGTVPEAVVTVKPPRVSAGGGRPSATKIDWQTRLHDRVTASVTMDAQYELPPELMFDLLADPRQHAAIFGAIQSADAELLEEEGPRRKWRLDYKATWSFWKVSGVCENRFWLWTDKEAGTVTFKLREPGFLRRYEGTWTIKPAGGGRTTLTTSAAAPGALTRTSSSTKAAIGSSGSSYILPPSATAAAPLAAISLLHNSQPLAALSAMQQRLQWGWGETLTTALSNFSNLGQALGGVWGLPALPAAPIPLAGSKAGVTTAAPGGWRQSSKQQPQQQQQRATTSVIHVETLSSPKISPPYPLNQILKAQAKGQVEDMLDGLVNAAAAKLTVSPLKVA